MDLLDDDQRHRLTTYHATGAGWVDELPELVGMYASRWGLTIGPTFRPGGDASWAARVTRADSQPAVLKIALPDPHGANAVAVLRLLGGRGAVQLLEYDSSHHASLLELCQPGTFAAALPAAEVDTAAASVLPQIWDIPPAALPLLPRLADVAVQRATLVRERADQLDDPLLRHGADLYDAPWHGRPSRRVCCTATSTNATCFSLNAAGSPSIRGP